MKAITAVCASGAASVGGVTAGRVHRQRRDVENEEIQMYLSKLKELVPFMPKNRRLSKLEVIQYVIDYICDLQYALETHPSVATAVGSVATAVTTTTTTTATAAAPVQRLTNSTTVNSAAMSPRQPLGVLAPNTIVPNTSCATQEQISTVSPIQFTLSPQFVSPLNDIPLGVFQMHCFSTFLAVPEQILTQPCKHFTCAYDIVHKPNVDVTHSYSNLCVMFLMTANNSIPVGLKASDDSMSVNRKELERK